MSFTVKQWQSIRNIEQALRMKSVAIVGLSSNKLRDSNIVGKYLLKNGYQITPVNPNESEIFGLRSFPTLLEIPFQIEVVNVFRDSSAIPAIAKEAVSIGSKFFWLQHGLMNLMGITIAEEANITCIVDKCIKVEHELSLLRQDRS